MTKQSQFLITTIKYDNLYVKLAANRRSVTGCGPFFTRTHFCRRLPAKENA